MKIIAWQACVASHRGPASPTTRHVLLTLAVWADPDTGVCSLTTEEIAERAALCVRSVLRHIGDAERGGWLEIRQQRANTKGWRRREYVARLPDVFHEKHAQELPSAREAAHA